MWRYDRCSGMKRRGGAWNCSGHIFLAHFDLKILRNSSVLKAIINFAWQILKIVFIFAPPTSKTCSRVKIWSHRFPQLVSNTQRHKKFLLLIRCLWLLRKKQYSWRRLDQLRNGAIFAHLLYFGLSFIKNVAASRNSNSCYDMKLFRPVIV